LAGCPKRHVSESALLVLQVLDSEAMPVVGGYLDQTQWYAEARRFVESEELHWERVDYGRKTA
jgi:hypothetical protein